MSFKDLFDKHAVAMRALPDDRFEADFLDFQAAATAFKALAGVPGTGPAVLDYSAKAAAFFYVAGEHFESMLKEMGE